jgi:hypothetical protein
MLEQQKHRIQMNTPTYTISAKAIDLVARIAEKVGELKGVVFCNETLKTSFPPNPNNKTTSVAMKYNGHNNLITSLKS